VFNKLFKLHLKLLLIALLFLPLCQVKAQNIFENRSPNELLNEAILTLKKLKPTETEPGKTIEPDNKRLRLAQMLVLVHKRADKKIGPAYTTTYLQETKACLENSEQCLEDRFDEYKSSFYTWLKPEDINRIEASLNNLKDNSTLTLKRAKVLQLIFASLELGVHEVDGPNDDSLTGEDLIGQYFSAAGVSNPNKELPPSRIDWAWCAAYVTSIINQAGHGFSFISLREHINACKEMDKLKHCHPVQVEFILKWAQNKARVLTMNKTSLQEAAPGDILVLVSPKSGLASHIGFYIGQSENCATNDNECWIYTIEGNAGPFINDKLENNWSQVQDIVKEEKISSTDYERLLDRVTIVKRPISSWDYWISL
jgi:hypothetical protein